MISDTLENSRLYFGLGERIKKSFEFLINTDVMSLKPGKYAIEGTDIYASVSDYTTKPPYDARYEAHRNYIDIQYVAAGVEKMLFSEIARMKESTAYDADKDICFYEGAAGGETIVAAGAFAVFMPQDVHMPSVMAGEVPEPVRKVVVKVKV